MSFLPKIERNRVKFTYYFSIGSLITTIAFAFLYGPLKYLRMLFTLDNLVISVLYLIIVGLAYFSYLIWGNSFASLLVASIQLLTMGLFVY
mmetsp:Transcript_35361/g.34391  ORF Transcript_35361/g.34391 Transcript_35361/m.34391 type:complete len:91 (+) Transcript_35361:318-590(+)